MVRGNVRGGKAYKKGKKGGNSGDREEGGGKFAGREDGQDYARAMKILGNRRVLCFCNDGVERVGKIRGGLCKGPNKKRIEEGDIVIVSHRSFDAPSSDDESEGDEEHPIFSKKPASTPVPESGAVLSSGRKDVVDILDKVYPTHWRLVRKEKGIHRYLFPNSSGDDATNGEDIFEEEPVKKKTENNDAQNDSDKEINVDDI